MNYYLRIDFTTMEEEMGQHLLDFGFIHVMFSALFLANYVFYCIIIVFFSCCWIINDFGIIVVLSPIKIMVGSVPGH